MTTDEVTSWVSHIIKVRLGELVYSEPCPPGHSIVKGHPNFQVRMSIYYSQFEIILITNKETQGLVYDRFRCQPRRAARREVLQVFDRLWPSSWAHGAHSRCCKYLNNCILNY